MYTSDRSLEYGSSIVAMVLPSSFWVISMGSLIKDDAEKEGECEQPSNRSICEGLSSFSNWVVVSWKGGLNMYIYIENISIIKI